MALVIGDAELISGTPYRKLLSGMDDRQKLLTEQELPTTW